MLKEEINENVKISVRHQDGSLKVEIKDENENGNDVLFLDKPPVDAKPKTLEFDAETLTEIPFINIDLPLHTKESSARDIKVIAHIITNLPADNDKYYIEHEEYIQDFRRSATERRR